MRMAGQRREPPDRFRLDREDTLCRDSVSKFSPPRRRRIGQALQRECVVDHPMRRCAAPEIAVADSGVTSTGDSVLVLVVRAI